MSLFSDLYPVLFWVCLVLAGILVSVLAGTARRLFLRCKALEGLAAQNAAPPKDITITSLLDIESLPFPASLRNLDGTYLRVNTALANMLHHTPQNMLGRNLGELDPESDFEFLFRQLLPAILQRQTPMTMEHTTGHGADRFCYRTTILPLLQKDGTPEALLLISQLLDPGAVPQYSRDGDTSLAGLALEMAGAGYWRMPADGSGTVYLSEGLRRAIHLPGSYGNKYNFMQDIYPRITGVDPEGAEKLREYLLSPKTGTEEDFQCPHKILAEPGRVLHIRFLARVIPGTDTAPPIVYGLFQDVTETRTFEEALRQETDRLMAMFESSPIGMVIVMDDRVLLINPYLTNLLGLHVGDDPYRLFFRPVVTSAYLRQRLDDNNGRVIGAEAMARTDDGREYTLLVSYRRITYGGREAVLGWVVDVTELKKNESELIAARDQAQLAAQVKSRFLANISHEIRTPMNAIIGLSYLLLQTTLTRKQREDLEKIEKSSRALLQLLNDILDVSKIEAGKLNLECAEFAINDVLLNLANMLAVESERKGLDMVFRVAPDVPGLVMGDALRLGQVLLNLTGNAIKFSSEGEVEVSVELVERAPTFASLRFAVTDHGIGIAEEQQAQLFQSFSQGDASSTRRFGGTGIGLALSKSLVEAMGGTMAVKSTLGQGSTFSFVVPLGTEGIRNRDNGLPSTLRGMRALVVDDSSIERGILGETLQRLHFRTDLVDNGLQAVEYVVNACQRGKPYQFVILDWKMPVMDGIETTQAILADPRVSPQPQIIMVTAHIGGNIFARAEQVGVRRVLLKPVNPSTLLDAVIDLAADSHTPQQLVATSDHPELNIPTGLHVLVAEDNSINQQVMQELLEAVGVEVDLANNGREALERANARDYDMIIMDIQMPEMDGISATMAIRAIPRLESVPIIAMTAHAMPEDREKSYAAGMNEHITKPVDPQELYRVIRHWAESGCLAPTPPERDVEVPEHLHFTGIEAAQALARIGGNVSLYTRLLCEFHTRYQYLGALLEQELDNGNTDGARMLLHTFKGICGSLGASTLAHHAGSVEAMLATGSLTASDMQVRSFREQLDTVMAGLHSLKQVPTDASADDPATREAELRRIMGEVITFINMQSPEAMEPLSTVQDYLAARCPNELDALLAALDVFDFDGASRAAKALCDQLGITL